MNHDTVYSHVDERQKTATDSLIGRWKYYIFNIGTLENDLILYPLLHDGITLYRLRDEALPRRNVTIIPVLLTEAIEPPVMEIVSGVSFLRRSNSKDFKVLMVLPVFIIRKRA